MADFPTSVSTWTNKTDGIDFPEADDVNQPNNEVIAIQNYLIEAPTEKTVASGVLTVTKSRHKVQPQSGTADDIDTISGMPENSMLFLYASDAGTDTLTFKHGTGNLSCFGAADIELSEGFVICFYSSGTVYVAGGGGGAATNPTYSVSAIIQSGTISTGDGKVYVGPMPSNLAGTNLVACYTSILTTSSSGAPTFMLARGRQASSTDAFSYSDMLSTAITIDAGEYSSSDAATPPVINTSFDDILAGDFIRVDCDVSGTGAQNAFIRLEFQSP